MGIVDAIAAAEAASEARKRIQKPHKDLPVAKDTAPQDRLET